MTSGRNNSQKKTFGRSFADRETANSARGLFVAATSLPPRPGSLQQRPVVTWIWATSVRFHLSYRGPVFVQLTILNPKKLYVGCNEN